MRKVASLVIALALFVSVPAFANEGGWDGKGNYGEKKVERLKEKLSLNDAQAAQIKAILDSKKEQMIALKKQTHDQINAVLTPEQRQKYEAMKKEFKEKHKERKEHRK